MITTADFYRLWARQLLHEFQTICYQYSLSLESPVFTVMDSRTHFGGWLPTNREIRISAFLIQNYSWDVTLQVLKHEIAHQICSEIFQEPNEGHGSSFIKACKILGLSEPFRRSQGDLPQTINRPGKNTSHKIIEKIRKLLALAESSNEYEARLAMEAAGRLLKRHNLSELEKSSADNYVYSIINLKRKRIEEYRRRIIRILTRFFYVKAICSRVYDPLKNETYKTFEIFGKKENVEIAEYCYHFLERKLSSLWQINRLNYGRNGRIAKKSYYLGVLKGFHDRLLDQETTSTKSKINHHLQPYTNSELMVAGDKGLEKYIQARYPRLSKRTRPGVKVYRDIFDTGVRAGRDLIFHKGIESDPGNSGKMLE